MLSALRAAQNRDGGWGYAGGSSWTEPTVYALLALRAEPGSSQAVERGLAWLRGARRQDGGWAPHPAVDQSTWVTALVALLPPESTWDAPAQALEWLLRQTGSESAVAGRLRSWLLGGRPDYERRHAGWPWFPGAASWIAPTALTILALQKLQRRSADRRIEERVEAARKFLMSRVCRDGGWNHGASRALGYETDSYPETTGMALLALDGVAFPGLSKALARAGRHLEQCRSAQASSWLELGLLAHGKPAPQPKGPGGLCRSTMDTALCLLAEKALRGNNLFLG